MIISPSGCRGIVGKDLTPQVAMEIASKFGKWAKGRVIVGRDTRPSGEMLKSAVVSGLLSQGCDVIDVGVAPTPVIIHAKRRLGIEAGIIISGSHNPLEWNALKLLSKISFTSNFPPLLVRIPSARLNSPVLANWRVNQILTGILNFESVSSDTRAILPSIFSIWPSKILSVTTEAPFSAPFWPVRATINWDWLLPTTRDTRRFSKRIIN